MSEDMIPRSDMEIILHEVIERAKPKWISVKERLPEIGVSVLALDKYGNIHNRYMYRCGDGGISWTAEHLVSRKDVTHWMPLPEAPKEG